MRNHISRSIPGLRPRLAALLSTLERGLVERHCEVRLALLAALAGEHTLLIGPPGTAKSELARRLHFAFRDARYFERLLTRFSVPEELFGPLSIQALEQDRYERHTAGFLPEASIAFIDEVFKANSAILNALLTLLNEREFDNGAGRQRCPLISAIGATNEVPEDEVAEAFFDRFLLRVTVEPVSAEGFAKLLDADPVGSWQAPAAEDALEMSDLAALERAAIMVALPPAVTLVFAELRRHLVAEQVYISDRRWVKIARLLRVAAASEGREAVGVWDLLLLPWCTAPDAVRQAAVGDWLCARLGVREAFSPPRLTRVVEAFEAQLTAERNANDLDYDEAGRLRFSAGELAAEIGDAKGGAQALRMTHTRQRRYGPVHIAARIRQIDELVARIDAYAAELLTHCRGLAEYRAQSLWLDATLAERAGSNLANTARALQVLGERILVARAGFESLPRLPVADGEGDAPAPVPHEDLSVGLASVTDVYPGPLLFESLEARLAALDELVRGLWLGGLTNAQGSLEPRLQALLALRGALVAGEVPAGTEWLWPSQPVAVALAGEIARLELARYCKDEVELADTVLMSILFHIDFIVDYLDRGADEATAAAMAVAAFSADWQERCGQMDELEAIFGVLPEDAKNARWDRIRGVLRSEAWQEVMRIRRLLEGLPELASLIRRLGRARESEDRSEAGRATVPVMARATAHHPEPSTVQVPDMPGETRGIHRSDRIARMLPAEAMLLGHPRLRLVWHARRAERTLLCYEDDDRMQEIRRHEAPVPWPTPQPERSRRLEMGPLLVCVDTSGSMQGGAEAVAKSTVLAAVRTAHAQKRACHVFAFGGPGEVVDVSLAIDADGIERLTRFLGQAFRGGTDVCGPIEAAIAKLEESQWRLADLLIVSDGEFGATAEVAARLQRVRREQGLRVQGILVGDRETIGFLEVSDDIFWVRDWRRYGGADVDSPLQSRSLTAQFFPGALRTQQNRESTVSGAQASVVVRGGLHRGAHQPEKHG